MPRTETDIPSTVLKSDRHAQQLWKKAHDSAEKTYGEGAAPRRVAFAALKHEYEKQGDRWVRKAEKGPSDPQARRSTSSRKKSTDPDRAPTGGGKVAKTYSEARQKGREAKREAARARSAARTRKGARAGKKQRDI